MQNVFTWPGRIIVILNNASSVHEKDEKGFNLFLEWLLYVFPNELHFSQFGVKEFD